MEVMGGQALVEGVMMVSPRNVAMSVRKPSGKIKTVREERMALHRQVQHLPFIRGIAALIEMMVLGTRGLMWSSNEIVDKKEQISSAAMVFMMSMSFLIGVAVFIALPLWISHLLTQQRVLMNLIDGILRILIFLAYLMLISQIREVRRLFEYHGAEHMAVHCYEARKPLEPAQVRKFSTLHPRCGTAFVFIVLLISIILFSLIWSNHWLIKFAIRILLLPAIAGTSYELLRLSAKHQNKSLFRWFITPGLWFQKITTREPDKSQIEVAIASLKRVLQP